MGNKRENKKEHISISVIGFENNLEQNPPNKSASTEYVVYPIRWFILIIYVLYSASNALHGIQYSIIQDAVVKYYGVSSFTANWTALVYMVVYIPLMLPGSWLIDRYGLRISIILGSFGTCVGSWLKVFSVPPNMFWLGFVGQVFAAAAQMFVLNVPPKLAAVWFGADQVSSACSIGVFGYQLGIAVGFVLPPMVVHTPDSMEQLAAEFQLLFYIIAAYCSVTFVMILLFFKASPPTPPSAAADLTLGLDSNLLQTIRNLFRNRNYVLLLVSYGINVGVFCAISTVINQIILSYFPNANRDVGLIGLVFVVVGLFGAVACGFVLDKTHKFKETTLVVYGAAVVGMLLLTFTLDCGHILVVYLCSGILGFFMVGYLPVGYELASEVTYPEPESTTTGILSAAVQVSGIATTLLYQWVFEYFGVLWSNLMLCVLLVFGTCITATIKSDLRRQAVSNKT